MLKITCEGVYYKNGGFVPAKDGPCGRLTRAGKGEGGHHGPRDSEGPQYRRQYGGAGHPL